MADGKVLNVTRTWSDAFRDGWGTYIVHDGKKLIRLTNRWVVMVEDNIDGEKG